MQFPPASQPLHPAPTRPQQYPPRHARVAQDALLAQGAPGDRRHVPFHVYPAAHPEGEHAAPDAHATQCASPHCSRAQLLLVAFSAYPAAHASQLAPLLHEAQFGEHGWQTAVVALAALLLLPPALLLCDR